MLDLLYSVSIDSLKLTLHCRNMYYVLRYDLCFIVFYYVHLLENIFNIFIVLISVSIGAIKYISLHLDLPFGIYWHEQIVCLRYVLYAYLIIDKPGKQAYYHCLYNHVWLQFKSFSPSNDVAPRQSSVFAIAQTSKQNTNSLCHEAFWAFVRCCYRLSYAIEYCRFHYI
jgi:hypothetical protein